MAHKSITDISAIIPVFNGRRFLKAAVASVLRQTLRPCELLLVDDGSSDGSCDEYLAPNPNSPVPIRVIRRPNGGQSAARNTAASEATGSLLAFLDQDDIWYPHHLKDLSALMKQDDRLGWVYSDLDEIDAEGLLFARSIVQRMAAHPKERIIDLLMGDMFVVPSASLVRKSAFFSVGGFDECLSGYEDDDLFLRLFRNGYANRFLPQGTVQWRLYPGSASTTSRMAKSRRIYVRKLIAMFPDDRVHMRFFTRDLIAPRFLRAAIAGFARALAAGDAELLRLHREEARYLLHLGRFNGLIRATVALMGTPWLFSALLKAVKPDVAWRFGLTEMRSGEQSDVRRHSGLNWERVGAKANLPGVPESFNDAVSKHLVL
jgi:glycosyltransferase involved in cell wall biosynthesis